MYMFLRGLIFSFSLAIYLGSWTAGTHDNLMCNNLRNWQIIFQSGCIILHHYQPSMKISNFPQPHQHLIWFFDSNHPSGKPALNIHWKDWCWSWNSNTLATWCEELTHWKRPWCWKRRKARGEGDNRGWDGWMALPTRWTWVWASSGSWWWIGKPGVLQSMGSQSWTLSDWTELILLGMK